MLLHFYLRFSTEFGQTIFVSGNDVVLGNEDLTKAFPLQYLNDQLWHGMAEVDLKKLNHPIQYKYILRHNKGEEVIEFGDDRIVDIEKIKADKIVLLDTWNYSGEYENAFYTKAFREVLLKKGKAGLSKTNAKKIYTHEFRVKAPLLKKDEILCIGGSAKLF